MLKISIHDNSLKIIDYNITQASARGQWVKFCYASLWLYYQFSVDSRDLFQSYTNDTASDTLAPWIDLPPAAMVLTHWPLRDVAIILKW